MSAPRRSTRLPTWQEWAVYVTLGALIVTGLAWLALDQWVRIAGEFGPEPHPAERWTLIVHGVAAYLFLVVGGAMIPVHIKLGWHSNRNRATGLALGIGCILLALTALGLYYLGVDQPRRFASFTHWTVGILILPLILIHATRGRRGEVTPQPKESPR